jgi:hypothetical protein
MEQEGCSIVAKLVSKLKCQNLAYAMSFDTIVAYETAGQTFRLQILIPTGHTTSFSEREMLRSTSL